MKNLVPAFIRRFGIKRSAVLVALGYLLLMLMLSATAVHVVLTSRSNVRKMNELAQGAIQETDLLFNLQSDVQKLQSSTMRIVFNTEEEDVAYERMHLDSIEKVVNNTWNRLHGPNISSTRKQSLAALQRQWQVNSYWRQRVINASIVGSGANAEAIDLYYTVLKPSFEQYSHDLEHAEIILKRHIAAELRASNAEVERSSFTVNMLLGANFLVLIAGGVLLALHLRHTIRVHNSLLRIRVERQLEMSRITIDIQEKQKQEIGRELHDNVNQLLTAAKLQMSTARDNTHPYEGITQSMQTIESAIQEIRALSKSLATPMKDKFSLKEAVVELAHTFQTLLPGCIVRVQISDIPFKAGDSLAVAIYRIIQEQLTNISKHSCASSVVIRLFSSAGCLVLSISDNGKGFHAGSSVSGIGLLNMANRAKAFGGNLEVVSSIGHGCTIKVIVPIAGSRRVEQHSMVTDQSLQSK